MSVRDYMAGFSAGLAEAIQELRKLAYTHRYIAPLAPRSNRAIARALDRAAEQLTAKYEESRARAAAANERRA